jgi:hypothetical protein
MNKWWVLPKDFHPLIHSPEVNLKSVQTLPGTTEGVVEAEKPLILIGKQRHLRSAKLFVLKD